MAIKINQWIKIDRKEQHKEIIESDLKNNLKKLESNTTSKNFYKLGNAERNIFAKTREFVENEIKLFLSLKQQVWKYKDKDLEITKNELLKLLGLKSTTTISYLNKKLIKFINKVNTNEFTTLEITRFEIIEKNTFAIRFSEKQASEDVILFYKKYPKLKTFEKKVLYEKLEIKSFPKVGENDR